jgi:Secretion system C-terminal sorting domain/Beta-propeller repeat
MALTKPRMNRFFTILLTVIGLLAHDKVVAQINIQWASRYTSAGSNTDRAIDIDRDTTGNVIVTGTSWNGSNFDIVTVKYDPTGNQLWASSFNGSGNGFDEARSIDVDDNGNSYITGYTLSTGNNYNIITIKYDASGNQMWATTYNGSANGFDEGYDITSDAAGNVYVCGSAETSNAANYVTIKYNSAGVQQWATLYNGSGANSDQAYALTLDGSGNVYVTGYSWGGTTPDFDIATIKYNNSGVQQWVYRYNGPGTRFDSGQDIEVNGAGEVYVCGYARAAVGITNYESVLLKIDNSGIFQWAQTYNGPGNDYDRANKILIQSNGNVVITGRSVGTTSTAEDLILLNYNGVSGSVIWERRYDGGFVQWDEGKDLSTDQFGNIYVTGYSYNSGSNNNYITFKYDSLGTMEWLVKYNGPANNSDQAFAMFTDTLGNIYLTGQSKGSGTLEDYNTIKYCQLTTSVSSDTSICLGDAVQLNAISSFGGIDTMVWTPSGSLDLSNPFAPIASPTSTTTYVVALTNNYGCTDYDTVVVTVIPLPGPAIQSSGPLGFCQGGNVILTAVDTTNSGASFLWNTTDTTQSITVSASGIYSVIITDTNTCSSQSQITVTVFSNPTITAGADTGFCQSTSIQMCASGGANYAWAPNFGVSDSTIACPTFGPTSSTTYTVTGTDANGCSGADTITLSLYPPPSVPVISQSMSVLTSTPAFSYQWFYNSSPINGATSQSYTATQNGTYYVQIADSNGCTAFSATFSINDVGIASFELQSGIQLYPNPNEGEFTIHSAEELKGSILEIYNIAGAAVYSEKINQSGNYYTVNVGFDSGTYLVRITNANGEIRMCRMMITH